MLEYLPETIRWFVGFILLSAGWGKCRGYVEFKDNLVTSFGFPKSVSNVFTPLLIMVEWSLAIIILSNTSYTYSGMIGALIIFSAFTSFLLYYWLKDARIQCNCFGLEDRPVSSLDILRNIVIIGCLIIYLVTAQGHYLPSLEVCTLLAGSALLLSIVVIHLHDVVMLLTTTNGRR